MKGRWNYSSDVAIEFMTWFVLFTLFAVAGYTIYQLIEKLIEEVL